LSLLLQLFDLTSRYVDSSDEKATW